MNVPVRFSAVAAIAALIVSASHLAAQAAAPNAYDARATYASVGLVPNVVIDSVTALASAPSEAPAPINDRGPSIASARVASHQLTTPRGAPPVIQKRSSNRNAVALMAVGGAALILGSVIGNDAGTLVMLGGAGIGLYGLYLFLT